MVTVLFRVTTNTTEIKVKLELKQNVRRLKSVNVLTLFNTCSLVSETIKYGPVKTLRVLITFRINWLTLKYEVRIHK